ncbi:MAG: tetratricopeptide repeat protein [Polyangiales bacterium]
MSKRLEMLEAMIAKGSVDPFVHYARAMELRSAGRLDEALAAYEDVATRFPGYVPTYLMGGQVAEERGLTERARSFFERGIAAARTAGDGKALSELTGALHALD